jgi:hypothetical protein
VIDFLTCQFVFISYEEIIHCFVRAGSVHGLYRVKRVEEYCYCTLFHVDRCTVHMYILDKLYASDEDWGEV